MVQRDGRPRRKDFDADSQIVIDLAVDIYEASLASESLFPDTTAESRFVNNAWDGSCQKLEQKFDITPEVFKIVRLCLL